MGALDGVGWRPEEDEMRRSRFTQEQIVGVKKKHETGARWPSNPQNDAIGL